MKKQTFKLLFAWVVLIAVALSSVYDVALASERGTGHRGASRKWRSNRTESRNADREETPDSALPLDSESDLSSNPDSATEPQVNTEPDPTPGSGEADDGGIGGNASDNVGNDVSDSVGNDVGDNDGDDASNGDADGETPNEPNIEVRYELRISEWLELVYDRGASQSVPAELYRIMEGTDAEGLAVFSEEMISTPGDGNEHIIWTGYSASSAGSHTVSVSGQDGENEIEPLEAEWFIDTYKVTSQEALEASYGVSINRNVFTYGESASALSVLFNGNGSNLKLESYGFSDGAVENGSFAVGEHSVDFVMGLSDNSNCEWADSVQTSDYSGSVPFAVDATDVFVDPPMAAGSLEVGMAFSELNLVGGTLPPGGQFVVIEPGVVDVEDAIAGVVDVEVMLAEAGGAPYENESYNLISSMSAARTFLLAVPVDEPITPITPVYVEWPKAILDLNGTAWEFDPDINIVFSPDMLNYYTDVAGVKTPLNPPPEVVVEMEFNDVPQNNWTIHDAGRYTITFKSVAAGEQNYTMGNPNLAIFSISFSINKCALTVVPNGALQKPYGLYDNTTDPLKPAYHSEWKIEKSSWSTAKLNQYITGMILNGRLVADYGNHERLGDSYPLQFLLNGLADASNYSYNFAPGTNQLTIVAGTVGETIHITPATPDSNGSYTAMPTFSVPAGYAVSLYGAPLSSSARLYPENSNWNTGNTINSLIQQKIAEGDNVFTYDIRNMGTGEIETKTLEFNYVSKNPFVDRVTLSPVKPGAGQPFATQSVVLTAYIWGKVGDYYTISPGNFSTPQRISATDMFEGSLTDGFGYWMIPYTYIENPGTVTVSAWNTVTAGTSKVSTKQATIDYIDTKQPALTLKSQVPTATTSGTVTLTIEAIDVGNFQGGGWIATNSSSVGIAENSVYVSGPDYNNVSKTVGSDGTVSIVISKNGVYTITAKDWAGNQANPLTVTVDNIKTNEPQIFSVQQTPSDATNTNVEVTVTVLDRKIDADSNDDNYGIQSITIQAPDGTRPATTPVSFPIIGELTSFQFTAKMNGNYSVQVQTIVGKYINAIVTVDNIDRAAPSVTPGSPPLAPQGAVNPATKNATVSFTATDPGNDGTSNSSKATNRQHYGVKEITVASSPSGFFGPYNVPISKDSGNRFPDSFAASFNAPHNGDYLISVKDVAGNSLASPKSVTVDWIDCVPPVVQVDYNQPNYDKTPKPGPIRINITATDEGKDGRGTLTNTKYVGIQRVKVTGPSDTTLVVLDAPYDPANPSSFLVYENGTYEVCAWDYAGNKSIVQLIQVYNITNNRPVIVSPVNYQNDKATFRTVDVILTVVDAVAPGTATRGLHSVTVSRNNKVLSNNDINLRVDPGLDVDATGKTITVTFTATESGNYEVTVVNLAGNANDPTNRTVSVPQIDHTAPVVTIRTTRPSSPPTGATNQSVRVSYSATDTGCATSVGCDTVAATGSKYFGVAEVQITGPAGNPIDIVKHAPAVHQVTPTPTFLADSNGTYTVEAWDLAEINESRSRRGGANQPAVPTYRKTITVDWIDRTKPTVDSITCSNTGLATNLTPQHNGPVTLTVVASDKGYDGANAIGTPTNKRFVSVSRIDVYLNGVLVSDSGMVKSKTTEAAILDGGPARMTATYNITKNGKYTFIAYDAAGNPSASKEYDINFIDTIKPTIQSARSNVAATRQPVVVTLTISDTADAGCAAQYYGVLPNDVKVTRQDGTTLATVATKSGNPLVLTFEATESGTYYVNAQDKAGNQATRHTIVIENIDKQAATALTIDGYAKNKEATNQDVIVTFSVADTGDAKTGKQYTGVGKVRVTSAKGTSFEIAPANIVAKGNRYTATFNAPDNGIYTVEVWDKAGTNDRVSTPDIKANTVYIDWIDRVPPILYVNKGVDKPMIGRTTFWLSTGDTGNGKADSSGIITNPQYVGVASVVAIDTASGEGIGLSLTGDPKDAGVLFIPEKNGVYRITAVDYAGNSTTITIVVDNIDEERPHVSAAGYMNVSGVAPFMKVHAWDDTLLEKVYIYKYDAKKESSEFLEFVDLSGQDTKDYTFNYFPKAAGTYYAVAMDSVGNLSARSQYVTFGGEYDSDFDGINDSLAALLGYPPANELGIPLSSLLRLGYNLRLFGEKAPAGVFANPAMGQSLLETLVDQGLATIRLKSTMDLNALDTAKTLEDSIEILQLDYRYGNGIGLLDNYLVFFESNGTTFALHDAISLAQILPSVKDESPICLASADGNLLLLAAWDGTQAVSDLTLLDVQNRIFASINGSGGCTRFDMDALGSQVAYVKNDNLTVLNVANSEALTYTAMEADALYFTDSNDLLLSVTGGWRTTLVGSVTQELLDDSYYFTSQRGAAVQSVCVVGPDGKSTATFDGRLYIEKDRKSAYAMLAFGEGTVLAANNTAIATVKDDLYFIEADEDNWYQPEDSGLFTYDDVTYYDGTSSVPK